MEYVDEDGTTECQSTTTFKQKREFKEELELNKPNICVICLEPVSSPGAARPCTHDQFHFSCLGQWLQRSRACPLCKRNVVAISYKSAGQEIEVVLNEAPDTSDRNDTDTLLSGGRRMRSQQNVQNTDQARHPHGLQNLTFRRQIYREGLRCTYIGANALSGYKNVTPITFARDQKLISKAQRWLRRELQVFDFLNPDSQCFGSTCRRATNAEYLLDYIILILKWIDIKDSAGQAEVLLAEYVGRDNAQVLLHELESWLRSPYERLEDWDASIQYR